MSDNIAKNADVRASRMEEIRARVAAATPGPWEHHAGTVWGGIHLDHEDEQYADLCFDASVGDAAFIAHAREDVPWLLAEVDRLRAELDEARLENSVLRGIAAKVMPCHYCGAEMMAKCPSGFPGCGLADDLLAADEVMDSGWRARAEAAERERDEARRDLAAMTHQRDYWEQRYETQHRTLRHREEWLMGYNKAAAAVTLDLHGCARCDGDGHPCLTFNKLTQPFEYGELHFTHWAPCPTNGEPILLAVTMSGAETHDDEPDLPNPPCLYIKTPEGMMEASRGDWIIRGVKGEFYSCKPDVFEQTYEPTDAAHVAREGDCAPSPAVGGGAPPEQEGDGDAG